MAVSDLDRTGLATAGPAVPTQASVSGLAANDEAHPKDAHRMSHPTEPTPASAPLPEPPEPAEEAA